MQILFAAGICVPDSAAESGRQNLRQTFWQTLLSAAIVPCLWQMFAKSDLADSARPAAGLAELADYTAVCHIDFSADNCQTLPDSGRVCRLYSGPRFPQSVADMYAAIVCRILCHAKGLKSQRVFIVDKF